LVVNEEESGDNVQDLAGGGKGHGFGGLYDTSDIFTGDLSSLILDCHEPFGVL
jgi:hypothetical protein